MQKFLFSILLILFVQAFCPVSAGEFRVYSPDAYKQITKYNNSPSPSRIAPTRIHGEAIELVVDYSGSMSGWIGVARETLDIIIPRLPQSSAVALRLFGEKPGSNPEITNVCQSTRLVSNFRKNNQSGIENGLNDAKLGGGTPIEYTLRETIEKDLRYVRAFDKNSTNKKKKIILVTDGAEGCGGDPCAYIREVMRTRRDITIDVIQVGFNNRLMCLADETGGTYHQVNGKRAQFETAFETAFDIPAGTVAAQKYAENSTYKKPTPKYNNTKPMSAKYKFVNY